MRILVIGGTRFIGAAAVKRLCELGHRVTVFHRGHSEADLPPSVEHIHGDRARLADFKGEFARLQADTVIDMLPFTEEEALTVMTTCWGLARRIMGISSQDVYRAWGRILGTEPGPPDPLPLAETAPLRERLYPYRGKPHPSGIDARYDKIPVERVMLSNPDLPGTILRLPAVYGPLDTQHRLFPYLKRMDDGRQTILLDERLAGWQWSKSYVENVAQAIALAATSDAALGKIFNVAEPDTPTEAEWVRLVGRLADWHGEVVVAPAGLLPDHLAPGVHTEQSLVTDSTRLRRELGYEELVDRDEALRRTIAWERANPPAAYDPQRFDYAAEDAALAKLRQPA